MPDLNCSFMEEGIKIHALISAVKRLSTHFSQSSTVSHSKPVLCESCNGFIPFPVTKVFKRLECV